MTEVLNKQGTSSLKKNRVLPAQKRYSPVAREEKGTRGKVS